MYFGFVKLHLQFFCSWGRWEEIRHSSGLRKNYSVEATEDALRLTLLYCVNTYRGDEKLRTFIWELITPSEYADNQALSSRKKNKRGKSNAMQSIEWIADEKYDMDRNLDKNYRKHLDRHNNKILLRVKLLHTIANDILGAGVIDKLQSRSRPLK